jgi:hypothetical protein
MGNCLTLRTRVPASATAKAGATPASVLRALTSARPANLDFLTTPIDSFLSQHIRDVSLCFIWASLPHAMIVYQFSSESTRRGRKIHANLA